MAIYHKGETNMVGSETKKKRTVKAEELERLGFPAEDIAAARRMENLGLFHMEPSPDLVERTLQKCIHLLKKHAVEPEDPIMSPVTALLDPVAVLTAEPALLPALDLMQLLRSQQLPHACLEAAKFARSRGSRPVVMLDNHNLIEPTWWDVDNGFRAFWNACQITNRIVRERGGPPAATVVVLRHDPADYSDDDLAAIRDVVRKGTSDLWWLGYKDAGEYQGCDVIVVGEETSWELKHKPKSPVEALDGFEQITSTTRAIRLCGEVTDLTRSAMQIRVDGKLLPDECMLQTFSGIRELIGSVIFRR